MPNLTRERAIATLREWEQYNGDPAWAQMYGVLALALERGGGWCEYCDGNGFNTFQPDGLCAVCHGTGLAPEMQAALRECGLGVQE